jgi:F-type H+-transporting ATPase subunit delta
MKTSSESLIYAKSLIQLAKAGVDLQSVNADLQLAVETVTTNLELKEALASSRLANKKKRDILEEIFSSRLSPLAVGFINLLVSIEKINLLPEIAEQFNLLAQTEERKVLAEVTTAIPLDEPMLDKLTKRLSQITGKDVVIRHRLDPDIIGGLVVRIDGRVLDGSLKHQLNMLKEKMIMGEEG